MDDEHATESLILNFCRPSVALILYMNFYMFMILACFFVHEKFTLPSPGLGVDLEKTVIVISLTTLAYYASCD